MTDRRGSLFVEQDPQARELPKPIEAPTTTGEIVGAHWTLGRQDFAGAPQQAEIDAYGPIVTALHQRGERVSRFVSIGGSNPVNTDALWQAVTQQRERDPEFMKDVPARNAADFSKYVADQEAKRRASAQSVVSRQRGIVQNAVGFGADIATGFADPINLGAMVATGGFSEAAPVVGGAVKTLVQGAARDAIINAGIETVELPTIAQNRAKFGEDMTAGEALAAVGIAGAGGAAFHLGVAGAGRGASAIGGAIADSPAGKVLAPLALRFSNLDGVSDADVAQHFSRTVPPEVRSPDEQAAIHVIRRQSDIDRVNPFVPTPTGMDAHAGRLGGAINDVLRAGDPDAAPRPVPRAPSAIDGVVSRDIVKAHIHTAEAGGGSDFNPGTGATGPYQFLSSTWNRLYKQRFGDQGLSDAQISAKRRDPALNDVLMNDLMDINSRALRRIGAPETTGNLYLLHFLGEGDGPKVLTADPRTPISDLIRPIAIEKNPFLRGKNAGEVVEWARGRMGDRSERVELKRDLFQNDDELAVAQRHLDDANAEADASVRNRAPATEDTAAPAAAETPEREAGGEQPTPIDPAQAGSVADTIPDATATRDRIIADEPIQPTVPQSAAPDDGLGPASSLSFVPREGKPGVEVLNEEGHFATAIFRDEQGKAQAVVRMPISEEGRAIDSGVSSYVRPEFRRQGVATKLYDALRAAGHDVDKVSGAGDVTPAGAAFINSRRARLVTRRAEAERALAERHTSLPEEAVDIPDPRAAPPEAEITSRTFDEPSGPEADTQVMSMDHDARIILEANPDATFRIGDDEAPRSLVDIIAEQDADMAAIEAARSCL